MSKTLPRVLHKYFWGDNLTELTWPVHKKYIIQTLLERGNPQAIKWLFETVSQKELYTTLKTVRLSKKSYNFWHHYLV